MQHTSSLVKEFLTICGENNPFFKKFDSTKINSLFIFLANRFMRKFEHIICVYRPHKLIAAELFLWAQRLSHISTEHTSYR